MPDESLLPVGRIRKPHGIRGEVSVDYYADSPDFLDGDVYLQRAGQVAVTSHVVSFRAHHGAILVLFAGVTDRNAAEDLRNCEILVPESRFPKLDDDIYLHEILGLRVIAVPTPAIDASGTGKDTSGDWGTITAVADNAGQELWTVSKPGEEDILFPAVPELVLEFDLDARIVRIAPPPGLFDLYRH